MNELRDEIERVLLQITPEDLKKAKDDEIARGGEKGVSLNSRAAIYSLDRQLKSSLAANREQKATLGDRDNHIDLAYKALGDVNRSVYLFDHIREQKAEIERLTKEKVFLDFGNARKSSIAHSYGGYEEIKSALGTEITMHAAWRKRAEEAEAELASLRASVGEKPEDAWGRGWSNGYEWARAQLENLATLAIRNYVAPTLPGEEK